MAKNKSLFKKSARDSQVQQVLEELERKALLNKGGFSTFAEDTDSNVPFMLPGAVKRVGLPQKATTQIADVSIPEFPDLQELPEQEQQQQGQISANDFIQKINENFGQTFQPSAEELEQNYQSSGTAYSVANYEDGSVGLNTGEKLNPDGTVNTLDNKIARPVASEGDGGIRYDDGLVRYFDPVSTGASGFVRSLFGVDLPMTQTYGNYNPGLYGAGLGYRHPGTDYAADNLPFHVPVTAKVVKILREGESDLGNSVWLEFGTGETVAISHLSDIGDFQEGQILLPGQYAGTTGNTGKSTGAHVDFMYFDANGNKGNLDQFSGFSTPELLAEASYEPEQLERTARKYDPSADISRLNQPQQPQQPQQQPQRPYREEMAQQPVVNNIPQATGLQRGANVLENIGTAVNAPGVGWGELNRGDVKGAATELGRTLDVANLTGNVDPGVSEGLEKFGQTGNWKDLFTGGAEARQRSANMFPNKGGLFGKAREGLGKATEFVGDTFGIPETNVSEMISGKLTPRYNQAQASFQPDNQKFASYEEPKFSAAGQENVEVSAMPGEGLKPSSKSPSNLFGVGKYLFNKPQASDITDKRAVGEISGGNVLGTLQPMSSVETPQILSAGKASDIRDPFFKQGLDQQFGDYIDPEKAKSGALTMDLFSDKFFESPENVNTAFGGTSLYGQAQGKLNESMARLAEIEANKPKPTLQDYLNQGKTATQWYAETGQQSSLDQIKKDPRNQFNETTGNISRVGETPNVSEVRDQGSRTGVGSQNVALPSGRTVSAAPGTSIRSDSSGNVQQVEDYNLLGKNLGGDPVKSQSGQLTYEAQLKKKKPGIFNQIINYFRR